MLVALDVQDFDASHRRPERSEQFVEARPPLGTDEIGLPGGRRSGPTMRIAVVIRETTEEKEEVVREFTRLEGRVHAVAAAGPAAVALFRVEHARIEHLERAPAASPNFQLRTWIADDDDEERAIAAMHFLV